MEISEIGGGISTVPNLIKLLRLMVNSNADEDRKYILDALIVYYIILYYITIFIFETMIAIVLSVMFAFVSFPKTKKIGHGKKGDS